MTPLTRLQRIRLACEILAAYVSVRRLVRHHTLPETVAVLRLGAGDGAAPSGASPAVARQLARATVRTVTLLPADTRCLMRSLVLIRVMARRGLGSTLLLSAPPPGPGFEPHAWIEHGGEPLLAPAAQDHQLLLRL